MNMLEKRKLKRELKEIKKVNNQVKSFLDALMDKYKFNVEEKDSIREIKFHMDNLNLIFSQMMLGVKNK